MLALAVLGVDLTKVTILAGAFGVGIGFGLQNVVNNFVSGAGRPVRAADQRRRRRPDRRGQGRVQQMGTRACTVRTWEGAEVIVPNASLISEKVINWTLSDRLRRVDVAVGVVYGTAPEKVLDISAAAWRARTRKCYAEPAPVALFRDSVRAR